MTIKHRMIRIVSGQSAILALQPGLAELARQCGQSGEVDNLAFFLNTPGALLKTPLLACGLGRDGGLQSAVLLYQYRFGPFGLRIFTTADATGRRNVIAAPADREAVSAAAARQLLRQGAHAVHVAFSRSHWSDEHREPADSTPHGRAISQIFHRGSGGPERPCRGRWALCEHEMRVYLPLAATLDGTLAGIGQRTRSNLRYYRKRAEADLGSTFIPEARLTREEFIAFDRRCHYPVGEKNAGWRYDSISRICSPFLSGIKGKDGEWLALVGGRRQSGLAEIDWQMNRDDLPRYSLGTVLRAYLIEHEIALGSKRLYVEGGTPHAIGLSFAAEQVAEFTVLRESTYARLVMRFGPKLAPAPNYLVQMLTQKDLTWHPF